MIPQERGLKGLSVYFIYFFNHFCFNGEYELHEILGGKSMWFFNSKKIDKPIFGLLGGSLTHSLFIVHIFHSILSPFILSPTLHSSFILILAWERKMNCGEDPWFCWQ
jgi:hypothetical protein